MNLIYMIKNKLNGKIYIGKTNNLRRRMRQHKNSTADNKLHNEIHEFGLDNFSYKIVEENIPDRLINEREIYWIKYFDSFKSGYNCTVGGDGNSNPSVETRKRMRKSHLEFNKTEQGKMNRQIHKERMMGDKNPFYGKKHNDKIMNDIKEKIKEFYIKYPTKHPMYGKPRAEETKKKISEKNCVYNYELISPTKKVFIISNLNKFCKENNLDQSAMYLVVHGKHKHHKKWNGRIIGKIEK